MIKWPITYEDYDGNQRTEEAWFHLTKTELIEMELSTYGMERMLNKITSEQDNVKIFATLKDLILKAYGEKSLDGRSFVKSPEKSAAFAQTAAFDALIMSFFSDSSRAAEFVRGIVPKELAEEAARVKANALPEAKVVPISNNP